MHVVGAHLYGTQPFNYGVEGSDNDYSECYLIAQIWNITENATVSFVDVKAEGIAPGFTELVWDGSTGLVDLSEIGELAYGIELGETATTLNVCDDLTVLQHAA